MQLPNRDARETDYLRIFNRLSAAHRAELKSLIGNPPNWNNVPDSFWQTVANEEAAALILLLSTTFYDSAIMHGAKERDAELFGNYTGRAYGETIASRYAQASFDALASAQQKALLSRPQADYDLAPHSLDDAIDGIFSDSRDSGIVETEVTRASVLGGEWAVGSLGLISQLDLWKTNPTKSSTGPCQYCQPMHAKTRPFWASFYPEGPPSPHPRCVCEILYRNLYDDARWQHVLATLHS